MNASIITAIAALLAAMTAIIAPIVTTFLNNRHNLRIKRIELIYENKLKSYSEFAHHCGQIYYDDVMDKYHAFLSSAYKASVLCDAPTRINIHKLIDILNKGKQDKSDYEHQTSINNQYQICISALNEDLLQYKDFKWVN